MIRSKIAISCVSAIFGFLVAALIFGSRINCSNAKIDAYAEMASINSKHALMWKEFAVDMVINQLSNEISRIERRLDNCVEIDPYPEYMIHSFTNFIECMSQKPITTVKEGGDK